MQKREKGELPIKRAILAAILAAAIFAAVYLAMCYLIPGIRIKLAAPPAEYFRESVRHMAPFKGAVSLAAGLIAGALPWLIRSR